MEALVAVQAELNLQTSEYPKVFIVFSQWYLNEWQAPADILFC